MGLNVDGDSRFLEGFLPEFEYLLADRAGAEECLGRLREHYQQLPESVAAPAGRIAVITVCPWRNWAVEVKAAALSADLVICDDPFLRVQDHLAELADFYRRTFGPRTDQRLLVHLRRQVEWMWDVFDLVRAGVVIFRPFRMADDTITAGVREAARTVLFNHIEVLDYDLTDMVKWAKYRMPVIGTESQVEVDLSLITELGMSLREVLATSALPAFTLDTLSTYHAVSAADAVRGTFWTGSWEHWRLAHDAVSDERAKAMSFVATVAGPALESASARDILSIRQDSEAFAVFQSEIALAGRMIGHGQDQEQFAAEAQALFDDVFRPRIRQIESEMKTNSRLRELPIVVGSVGLSTLGSVLGADQVSATATLASALGAALGFTAIFRNLVDAEARVRSRPAFVLWKLGG